MRKLMPLFVVLSTLVSCNSDTTTIDDSIDNNVVTDNNGDITIDFTNFFTIDFNNLSNYEALPVPNYINEDNTPNNNVITNEGAVLGRILFYDNNLSVNNTISCASCHKQTFAFGDDQTVSQGVNGTTGRHSMRLINARFGNETNFFWDERANSLEEQTTQPIQDHIEMGFSGQNGDPSISDLIVKLDNVSYYPELFNRVFGSTAITEGRMQNALAQFIRSIQSFDSKYDAGRSQVGNNNQAFPNFTDLENQGKQLFMQNTNLNNQGVRINGGLGCANCHNAPEFSIAPNRGNNVVIGAIGSNDIDIEVTRSPTLRDILGPNGQSNGAFFHDASAVNLEEVIAHYNNIPQNNPNLDNRLRSGNNPQQLQMTQIEIDALIAFLETLSGSDVYTNEQWSNPFL